MSGIETVMDVLVDYNFQRRPQPLEVADTAFPFDGAAIGQPPSHDLVVVAGSEIPATRLIRMVSALARRLDVGASRRPITLVLVGTMAVSATAELERVARVLRVEEDPTPAQAKEALAVLLPLDAAIGSADREQNPLDEIPAHVKAWRPEWDQFINAAAEGQHAVEALLAHFVNEGANPDYRDEDADA